MLFHNKANSSSHKSGCSSIVKDTLKVCFMCQAREFGRCTSFGTLPKTGYIRNSVAPKVSDTSGICPVGLELRAGGLQKIIFIKIFSIRISLLDF